MSISILILTLNEERNLPNCLQSVQWCDDVVVLDSFSSDETPQIAASAGARVIQRRFDNWASHQNWAMQYVPFKHEWVFYLDADERMTEELRVELLTIAQDSQSPHVAYFCGRRNFFLGKWIRHAMPPGTIMRFFRPSNIRFERLVNPTPMIDGSHGFLTQYFDHYNFSKGLTEWFDKHNKYSLLEAMEGQKLLNQVQAKPQLSVLSLDSAQRRQALKQWSFRLPFRPALKFLYLYVVNRGFLDGRPGLIYCLLQSIYEYMIVIKMRELQRREKGLPV
jgi:glycosyltransferase involved in cell wall biosynthesis